MSQTMYAIKKVGSNSTSSTNNNAPSNPLASTKPSSVTSSATSVWQKKKRKRGNKNNKNKNNDSFNDEDNSSNPSHENTSHSPSHSPHSHHSHDDSKDESSNEHSNNKNAYDPASNPYSLENFKKNHELQKKMQQSITKHTQKVHTHDFPQTSQSHPTPTVIHVLTNNHIVPLHHNHHNTHTILTNTKSPMSQVRLTPLFPTPPSNGHGYNGRLPPSFPPNTMSTTVASMNPSTKHIQYLSSNAGDTDPTQCPHGNLTAEELINIKIRKRNVCYVVGLPIHVATETKLRTQEWFGQFGNIATIAINRNSKSIQANSIPAHITYDNDISALNAINFCNKFIFDDGRKLKATFGTQHYCRWFIAANKKCTNVFCGFRHSWCKQSDIITQKDINDFKAIPAGAYTSRNIENQPLGVRSVSTVHSHSHASTHGHSTHVSPNPALGPGAQTVPVYSHNSHGTASILDTDDKYLRIGHSLTSPLDTQGSNNNTPNPASNSNTPNPATQGNKPIDPIKITDPYTFYLSNSNSTPTGPGQPQIASVPPPNIPAIPNIYDSRNVLMKQIMNRNQNLQIENDRLTQQIKILSEMEIKNKQEIHRWWTELAQSQQNEKNLKAKYEKGTSDFKSLESKHDSLQIKYLALDGKYKHLLNCKNAAKKKEFESWDSNDVCKWIMNLDKNKFKKYSQDLCKNINTENIDGQCLESLDKGDLHRLGVTDFKDKKDLLQKIKELVTPKE